MLLYQQHLLSSVTQVTLVTVNSSAREMFFTPKESCELKHSFDAHWVSRKLASGIFCITAEILKHHSICTKEAGPPLVQTLIFTPLGEPLGPRLSNKPSSAILQSAWAVFLPFSKHKNLGNLVHGITHLFWTASQAAEDRFGGRWKPQAGATVKPIHSSLPLKVLSSSQY